MAGKTYRIAVIMDIAFSDFQEEPKTGIKRYADEHELEVVYFGIGSLNRSNPEDRARMKLLRCISENEFDGILFVSAPLLNYDGKKTISAYSKNFAPLPAASIGPSIFGEKSFVYNNSSGMKLIMDHLIHEHNYTTYAYISGPFSNSEAKERLNIFTTSLTEAGITYNDNNIYEGYFIPPSGYDAVHYFLDQQKMQPDVIVCANDLMALGAWNALKERGLTVPFDIGLTGFDDIQLSQAISHQFTTVYQSFEKLGFLATKYLHNLILNNSEEEEETTLEPELRLRRSCGCKGRKISDSTSQVIRGENNEEVRNCLHTCLEKELDENQTEGLEQFWTKLINRTLQAKRPIYELEILLHNLYSAEDEKKGADKKYLLIQRLYARLLEECGISVFADYWEENFFSMKLQVMIDNLQDALPRDLCFEPHLDSLTQIGKLCGFQSFSIFQYNNFHDISHGAKPIYTNIDFSKENYPKPDNWFPPRGSGSMVANMLTAGETCYGYLLMDVSAQPLFVYDYLRIRFNTIAKDMESMKNIHTLNQDLINEINERKDAEKKLKDALKLVKKLSIQDELTGLHNRRGFFALADQQIKYLRRQKISFFILYSDLDGLKTINDRYGHNEGDLAIATIAQVLQNALRDSDIICRLGGDEFTALISNINHIDFSVIKERIISLCLETNISLNKPWDLSVSIGYYFSDTSCKSTLDTMLDAADKNLYQEKLKKRIGSHNKETEEEIMYSDNNRRH